VKIDEKRRIGRFRVSRDDVVTTS